MYLVYFLDGSYTYPGPSEPSPSPRIENLKTKNFEKSHNMSFFLLLGRSQPLDRIFSDSPVVCTFQLVDFSDYFESKYRLVLIFEPVSSGQIFQEMHV